ncbi:MAG TPA: hypothetical protein VIG24_06650, partial [Acidimicrobiia bacterium]
VVGDLGIHGEIDRRDLVLTGNITLTIGEVGRARELHDQARYFPFHAAGGGGGHRVPGFAAAVLGGGVDEEGLGHPITQAGDLGAEGVTLDSDDPGGRGDLEVVVGDLDLV